MKKHLIIFATALLAADALGATPLAHDDELEGGLLTSFANRALERAMKPQPADSVPMRRKFGSNLTDWVSAPKLGAYYTGGYKYSSEEGKHGGPGFSTRLIRAYVSGTLLKYVDYRIQMELQSTVHLKDAYIEYRQFQPARIKMGQFKRPFSYENPMNPWDVGLADYSQLTKKMSGFSDHTATEYNGSNGGRDLGLQVQGDFLPVKWGKTTHPLLHYQLGVFNGQGINTSDANSGKDLIGTVQLQPVKGLSLGVFSCMATTPRRASPPTAAAGPQASIGTTKDGCSAASMPTTAASRLRTSRRCPPISRPSITRPIAARPRPGTPWWAHPSPPGSTSWPSGTATRPTATGRAATKSSAWPPTSACTRTSCSPCNTTS